MLTKVIQRSLCKAIMCPLAIQLKKRLKGQAVAGQHDDSQNNDKVLMSQSTVT